MTPRGAQRGRGDAVAGAQDAEQQVLGAHPGGAERGRLLARELDGGAGLGRDAQPRGSLGAGRRLGRGGELAVAAVRGLAGDAERAGDGAVGAAGVQRPPGLDALEGLQLAAQRRQRVQRDLGVRGADGVLEQLGEAVREVSIGRSSRGPWSRVRR